MPLVHSAAPCLKPDMSAEAPANPPFLNSKKLVANDMVIPAEEAQQAPTVHPRHPAWSRNMSARYEARLTAFSSKAWCLVTNVLGIHAGAQQVQAAHSEAPGLEPRHARQSAGRARTGGLPRLAPRPGQVGVLHRASLSSNLFPSHSSTPTFATAEAQGLPCLSLRLTQPVLAHEPFHQSVSHLRTCRCWCWVRLIPDCRWTLQQSVSSEPQLPTPWNLTCPVIANIVAKLLPAAQA